MPLSTDAIVEIDRTVNELAGREREGTSAQSGADALDVLGAVIETPGAIGDTGNIANILLASAVDTAKALGSAAESGGKVVETVGKTVEVGQGIVDTAECAEGVLECVSGIFELLGS